MAKQKSVFNSAKKGIVNQDLPERPWAQQAEKESLLSFDDEKSRTVQIKKDANIEEILHNEEPLAAVMLNGKLLVLRIRPVFLDHKVKSKILLSNQKIL